MVVEIQFISNLSYQLKAIESVVNIFDGTLADIKDQAYFGIISNPKIISLNLLNENLNRIQANNGLAVSTVSSLKGETIYDRPNFCVEMETGTGKTYIFIR